jgi:hypothetical protein
LRYTFVVYIIELLIVLAIALRFKNRLSLPYIVMSAIIFITVISETLSHISAQQIKSNSAIFHLFVPVEFSLISVVYLLLFKSKRLKQIVFIVIFVFAAFVLFNTYYLQSINQMPFNNQMLCSIIFIAYAFLLFLEMINIEAEESLFAQPAFWFNSGILIFYTATLVFWSIYRLVQFNANNGILHIVMWVLNLILYAFIGISIYLNGSRKANQL